MNNDSDLSIKLRFDISISTLLGGVSLKAGPGFPLFLLGRNGSGKSALAQRIGSSIPERRIYLQGARPVYFDGETLGMTLEARRQMVRNLVAWENDKDYRWKPVNGTAVNEKSIHDLHSAEMSYAMQLLEQIKEEGKESSAIDRLREGRSPLERINYLFEQSGLDIRFKVAGAELKAVRGGAIYSYAHASDGERAALLLAAEVVAAVADTTFIIDEPEKHLHPSIVAPLIASLMLERADCTFVISTHLLELPDFVGASNIALVRGVTWMQNGYADKWDLDVIGAAADIPEQLREEVYGGRRDILFVEGSQKSLDEPLYSLLFPRFSVSPRLTCKEVVQAVDGLNSVPSLHRISAKGLIDGDGMGQDAKDSFADRGIFVIPFYSIESVYFSMESMTALAQQQAASLDMSPESLVDGAIAKSLDLLRQPGKVEALAMKVAERRLREMVFAAIPKGEQLQGGANEEISVSLRNPYPEEVRKLTLLLEVGDFSMIVARYPVRESGILSVIAKELQFKTDKLYQRALRVLVKNDPIIRAKIRSKFGELEGMLK